MRALMILALLSALAPGCGHSEDGKYFGTTDRFGKPSTTFYVNNSDEPEYIDPGLSAESAGSALVRELFDGLVLKHPETLDPVQGVATHYEMSEDNTVFRFHLRPDAKWSDGKPVVAGDFVYAWRRVLTPATGARTADLMYVLKNGKLLHQGKAKRTKLRQPLFDAPEGAQVAALPAHQPLAVLATTPATTGVAPRPAAAGAELTFEEGELTGAEPLATPQAASILSLGPEVRCNQLPDRWYRVRVGETEGHLPGCALSPDVQNRAWAVVSDAVAEPSYGRGDESREPSPEPRAPRLGFVPLDSLEPAPDLVGVRATGEHTLEIELEEPTPHFLELLTYTAFMPVRKDVIEPFVAQGAPERWFRPENIVSNGPYVLESHKFRYEITMVRNPHHYDHDQLKLHRLVFLEVPSYHSTMNLYKTGSLDYIGQNLSLPAAYMDLLEGFEDFERSWWYATYWYELNTEKPPLDDARVRRALNLAMDKQLVVDKVARGGQMAATSYVPPFLGSGYSELVAEEKDDGGSRFRGKGHDFDPARGRQLLREAGYQVEERADGFHVPDFPALEILYNTSEGHKQIAVAVQAMWKRHLGISAQLRNEEWKVMIKNLRDRNYQVARFGWIADYNHPHSFLEIFTGYSHNNWTGWSDPRFDALVARAAATADRREAMKLYRQAEEVAVEAMPRIPMYFYTKSSLIKPYVRGFWPNVANIHSLRWMWIDPDWKRGGENVAAIAPEPLAEPGRIEVK